MGSDRHTYRPVPAKVTAIKREAEGIRTFRLRFSRAADRKRFDFMPGQFGQFSLMGIGEATFSMCSPPDMKEIEISIRNVGDVTGAMFTMKKGDLIGVRGPYGNGFPMDGMKGKDVIIVAGGIGFPPLASAAEYIARRREDYGRVTILYGVKTMDDLIYKDRVRKWEKDDIRIIETLEEGCREWDGCVGLVTDELKKLSISPECTAAISCGPPVMLRFVARELQGLGLGPDRIHLSLERMMQCGIGKCGHCNIGDMYVCRDGPVFSLSQLRVMKEDVW